VTVEATPSATGTVSDNRSIADNVTITPEKETPQTAPAVATAHMEKKKHARKDATGSVYASTQNISSVREEAKAEDLNNQILSLPDPAPAGGSSSSGGVPFWLMIVFCVLIPPLAVGLTFGIVDKFWISLLLTLLFWIPGVIYALIVVTQK
jgi:uncharacterized membrane protein YqaE (UPF0057 family)